MTTPTSAPRATVKKQRQPEPGALDPVTARPPGPFAARVDVVVRQPAANLAPNRGRVGTGLEPDDGERRSPGELIGRKRLRQPIIEKRDRAGRERESLAGAADDLEPATLKLAIVADLEWTEPALGREVEHHVAAAPEIGRVARLDIPREIPTPGSSRGRSRRPTPSRPRAARRSRTRRSSCLRAPRPGSIAPAARIPRGTDCRNRRSACSAR